MAWNAVLVIRYKTVEAEDTRSRACKRVSRLSTLICFTFSSGDVNRYWICFPRKSHVDIENFNLVRKHGSKPFDIAITRIRSRIP